MTLLIGIFIALIAINALLLIFSTSLRWSRGSRTRDRKAALPKSRSISMEASKS